MKRTLILDVKDPQDGFDNTVVGVVEMTPDLARLILDRGRMAKKMKEEDDRFARVAFWDHNVTYYEHEDEIDTDLAEALSSEVSVFVEANPFPETSRQNTEYDQMIVDSDHVWWRTSAKHSEVFSTASGISFVEVERFLREISQ